MKISQAIALFIAVVVARANQPEETCQVINAINQLSKQVLTNFFSLFAKEGYSALSTLPPQLLQYSGKKLNDLGFYDSCLQTGFNYAIMKVILHGVVNELDIGLCLPKQCQAQNLEASSLIITKFLQQYIPSLFKNISKIIFINDQEVYPRFDVFSGIILSFIILMLTLSFIGSIITMRERGSFNVRLFNSKKPTVQSKMVVQQQQPQQESRSIEFIKCFSFYGNFRKLISIRKQSASDDNFKIFNGIRVFSISWVIYGHTFMVISDQVYNPVSLFYIIGDPGWLTLCAAGYYAVDVFFFIGGFLSCVVILEKFEKSKRLSPVIIPYLYLHRFLRLWPTYMVCLFFYWKISVYMGNGPLWYFYVFLADFCEGTWWQNFLLIDNLFPHTLKYCYGWGWYMSNDIQIFLVAPPLLYLFIKKQLWAKILTWVLLFTSLLLSYIISAQNNYHFSYPAPGSVPEPTYMGEYYIKPWIRCAPYFMGIILAYAYRDWKFKTNETIVACGQRIIDGVWLRVGMYIVGIAMVLWTVWIVVPLQQVNKCKISFRIWIIGIKPRRVIFLTGLGILILPSLLKVENDPINILLSQDVFVPLARVSFCVYLVHFFVLLIVVEQKRQMVYLEPTNIVLFVISVTILSFFAGMLTSMIVEVSFMNLEQFFGSRKPREIKFQKKEEVETESKNQEMGVKL